VILNAMGSNPIIRLYFKSFINTLNGYLNVKINKNVLKRNIIMSENA